MRASAPAARRLATPGGALPAGPARIAARRPPARRVAAAASPSPADPPVVTDESVPEAHRGLHDSLYGDGGAEAAHGTAAAASTFTFHEGEDDGTAIVPIPQYLATREGERPVGVFAVYDARRILQYVSYSRNVVLSLRSLVGRVGEERAAHVRVMVFANRAMQSRAALAREAENWVDEAGTVPPGNGAEAELWGGGGAAEPAALDLGSMSEEEAAAYAAKKEKMRRAMGEVVAPEREDSLEERQDKMRAAMERGDWSEVVDAQTAETVDEGAAGAAPAPAAPQVVTPFARAAVHRSVGNAAPPSALPLTVDNVDRVLDDVRPYLIADGGNVEVVGVENGVVALQLQGACGTCPSSTATMKMGIERSLRAAFGDALGEVISVGGPVDTSATVEAVDAHLNMLRGAIAAYGGGVEVVAVGAGAATLRFAGPKPIGYGMVAALKDKFPDLTEVTLLDAESGEPIQF